MGKYQVVIDIGHFNTKICCFRKAGQNYVLESGAIFDTPSTGMKNPDTAQRISLFLSKLDVKGSELYTVFSEDNESIYASEQEYPIGTGKEITSIVKNNLPGLAKEDIKQYYSSWRFVREIPSGGQGLFQIVFCKKEYIDVINEIAGKYGMKYKRADISQNTAEYLALPLRKDPKHTLAAVSDASAIVEIGNRSVRVVVYNGEGIVSSSIALHNLYRMDRLVADAVGELDEQEKEHPELLKMNPAYAFRVNQYEMFLEALSAQIIKDITHAVNGDTRYRLNSIFFTGGLYKTPKLIGKVKENFGVPCYAYPISDYLSIKENCIFRNSNKIYPSEDVFGAAFGMFLGGV